MGYKAKDQSRIGLLDKVQLKELGLSQLKQELSKQAGRSVEFMPFDSTISTYKRPSILVY